MPELPEVETTRRGISPFVLQQTINEVVIRQSRLRFEIPADLNILCAGRIIQAVKRRAKYLIVEMSEGYLLNHLGMSGHLRVVNQDIKAGKHDHIDFILGNGYVLRYNDPRRFGFWLYFATNPEQSPLLTRLGPEPLSESFNANYLLARLQGKKQAIKSCIMTNEIVVGVGNIYATESLFLAGIHPQTSANRLNYDVCTKLVTSIKLVLMQAIKAGGTTLRDFYASDGKPGYFVNKLKVYGRRNLPCLQCQTLIQAVTIAGRNSAFCPACQTLVFFDCDK